MEDNFNITAESLKTQEDKIISQKATLVAILSEKNAEELAIESLDEGCEILQQQHEMLDQEIEAENAALLEVLQASQEDDFAMSLKRCDQMKEFFAQSLDKIEYIRSVGPTLLNEKDLTAELEVLSTKLQGLKQEFESKRESAQNRLKRPRQCIKMDEDTQLCASILLEMSELKKDEEEREAKDFQGNLDLGQKIFKMRQAIDKELASIRV